MRKIRILLCIVLVITIMSSLFTACTKKADDEKKTDTSVKQADKPVSNKQEKQVEITWWEYPNYNIEGKAEGEYEKEMLAAFNKKHPNIKVNLEMIAYNTGPEKINVAIATNTKPDLTYDFPGRIVDYGRQGVLVSLNDMFSDEIKKDISERVIDFCSYDGNIYMYPSTTTPFLLGFNKTLFEEIGALDLLPLDRPERAWTVEEYEKALRAVKEKAKGVFPAVFYCKNQGGDPSTRFLIMNIGNTNMINKEHTSFLLNSDGGVKGMQWVMNAYKEGLFAPGAEAYVSNDAIDMYLQGKAASTIIYSPVLQSIFAAKKTAQFEEVFLPWPTQPGQEPKIEVSVYGQCVFDNKDADKAAAAKKLIDFINNDSEWGPKNVKSNGGFPARNSMAGLYDSTELKYAESMVKYATDAAITAPRWAEMRTHWFPVLQGALLGKMTAKEAMDKFVEEANEVINRK